MSTSLKHTRKIKNKRPLGEIDPKVGNYEKHPFFVKKTNEAKAFLNKAGLPKQLTKAK